MQHFREIMYFKENSKPKFLVYLTFALSLLLIPTISNGLPVVKPAQWVYQEVSGDLQEHLKPHYASAKKKGLTPYVYIYSDRNTHCRSIRALMKRKDMQEAFTATYVVLLNFFDLRRQNKNVSNLMINFTPKIARISKDGMLEGEVMHPELYLYYPASTKEPELRKYSVLMKQSGPTSKGVFAKMMRKYFSRNNI